jgi:hypothetical protein
MATTIKLKNGSGAPLAGDLVAGEPALDLTNKRLYTEDSGGTVIEVGTNPTSVTTGAITSTGIDVTGVVEATGYLAVEGTSGNTGAGTDRWIGGDGTAGTWFYNVPTGSNHYFAVNNTNKLAINSTGIDVTGTVTADGLTVDASLATVASTGPNVDLVLTEGSTNTDARIRNSNGILEIDADLNNEFGNSSMVFAVDGTDKLKINNNGDISFYDSSGTSQSLYWDASVESLGIGTSSPSAKLAVVGTTKVGEGVASNTSKLMVNTASGTAAGIQLFQDGVESWIIQNPASTTALTFANSGSERMRIDSSGNLQIQSGDISVAAGKLLKYSATSYITPENNVSGAEVSTAGAFTVKTGSTPTERMRIDSSGNVGINTVPTRLSSNAHTLNIKAGVASKGGALLLESSDESLRSYFYPTSTGTQIGTLTNHDLLLMTNTTERMRIDSSGNLLVGKTSLGIGVTGSEIRANGQLLVTADGDNPADFNRKTSDGTIALFRQDSTTVGSIGVGDSDNLYITGGAGSTKGLIFTDDRIIAGANGYNFQDDNTTLGHPSYRFKDLYLSGGIDISQGTEPQNAFIDINQTILDDAVYSFTPDRSIGVMYIYGRNVNYDEVFGIVNYRTASAAFCTQQLDPSSVISTSTSVLTGTTGTDGQVTISAVQSDGKIYIENRMGKAISIGIHVTGQ